MEGNLFRKHHPKGFPSFDVLNRKYGRKKNTTITSNNFYDNSVSLSYFNVGRARLTNVCTPFVDNFLCPNKFSHIFPFTKIRTSHLLVVTMDTLLVGALDITSLQNARESKFIVWTSFSSSLRVEIPGLKGYISTVEKHPEKTIICPDTKNDPN